MMEARSLEPQVLLVGSNYFQQKMDTILFQQAGIKLISQKANQCLGAILKKQPIDIFVIESQCLDDPFKILLSKLRYFYPRSGLLLTLVENNENNRIMALQMGIDDCFRQDTSLQELQAKIHSLHRRLGLNDEVQKTTYHFHGYSVDLPNREVRNAENRIIKNITSGEFLLLKIFLEHPNRLLSRDFLLNKITHYNEYSCSRSIDIRVSRLRKKIKLNNIIKTVYGEGYIFNY